MPSVGKRPSVLLDAGANTDCKPEYLIDFALMGYEYAKSVLHYDSPKVGLLSNGEEDIKGNMLVKETHKMLKAYDFFYGNVEERYFQRGCGCGGLRWLYGECGLKDNRRGR